MILVNCIKDLSDIPFEFKAIVFKPNFQFFEWNLTITIRVKLFELPFYFIQKESPSRTRCFYLLLLFSLLLFFLLLFLLSFVSLFFVPFSRFRCQSWFPEVRSDLSFGEWWKFDSTFLRSISCKDVFAIESKPSASSSCWFSLLVPFISNELILIVLCHGVLTAPCVRLLDITWIHSLIEKIMEVVKLKCIVFINGHPGGPVVALVVLLFISFSVFFSRFEEYSLIRY